jgi:hypothetical protein
MPKVRKKTILFDDPDVVILKVTKKKTVAWGDGGEGNNNEWCDC